jgi:hypothetical protein
MIRRHTRPGSSLIAPTEALPTDQRRKTHNEDPLRPTTHPSQRPTTKDRRQIPLALRGWPTLPDLPTEAAASFAMFEGCALRLSIVPGFRFSPTTSDQRPTTITPLIPSAAKDLLFGFHPEKPKGISRAPHPPLALTPAHWPPPTAFADNGQRTTDSRSWPLACTSIWSCRRIPLKPDA